MRKGIWFVRSTPMLDTSTNLLHARPGTARVASPGCGTFSSVCSGPLSSFHRADGNAVVPTHDTTASTPTHISDASSASASLRSATRSSRFGLGAEQAPRGVEVSRHRTDDVPGVEELGDDELADAAGAAHDEHFRALTNRRGAWAGRGRVQPAAGGRDGGIAGAARGRGGSGHARVIRHPPLGRRTRRSAPDPTRRRDAGRRGMRGARDHARAIGDARAGCDARARGCPSRDARRHRHRRPRRSWLWPRG